MEFPTLYKLTATGAINRWTILVENNYYWTEFGKIDGILQTSDRTYCEAKNIGRANETTSEQQAILEASSAWKKKRDRDGFVTSIEELQGLVFEPPMLAKKFDGNYKSEMKFIQPKLDGIRCNISCNTGEIQALSRHNMAFNTTKHIEDELKELLESKDKYKKKISKMVDEYVYNLGNSAEVGAKYIIDSILKKIDEKKNNK